MHGNSLQRRTAAPDTQRRGVLLVTLILLAGPVRVLCADTSVAQNFAAQIEDVQTPPRVMHFCWANCFTLAFANGLYRRADGTDETWTVERFTSTAVILRRHDAPAAWNGFSADVTYRGQVSNDRLTRVTVNGNPVPDIRMAWGTALDTLPGSDVERDRWKSAQAQTQALAVNSPPPSDDIEPTLDGDASADAPPPLLNYEQSPLPEDGYLWTPGYWGWSGGGYYWVPGAWVLPPRMGLLWTPGYWAFAGAVYVFHAGYWGPHIGYYGGISYGYGYFGSGFAGGHWVGNSFAYNRAVSNVNASLIHNTYSEAVINRGAASKVSYNGGPGGISATPTAQERAADTEAHTPATPRQRQIVQQSAVNPELMARAFVDHPIVAIKRSAVVSEPREASAYDAAAPAGRDEHAAPPSGQHERAHVRPNATPHPQSVAEHGAAPDIEAHPQRDPVRPAAPKRAGATPAKAPRL